MSRYLIFLVTAITLCITASVSWAAPTYSNSTVQSSAMISGVVAETMDAGGYTYVSVQKSNGQIEWAAGPKTAVSKGQSVRFNKGTEMRGFKSPTLNRTFKTIYFTTAFQVFGTPSTSNKVTSTKPKGTTSAAQAPTLLKGGLTVEQLFTQSSGLSGKKVTFQGRVVKYNAGIMGKNWLHIQDGTGTPMSKNNDITVTTDSIAAVGDQVVVKGTLIKDKDFGSGYRYAVMIENASVAKQ